MAREWLYVEEFVALAAAVGVVQDSSLRQKLAIEIKSAIEKREPRRWTEGRAVPLGWKRWFELCRVDAPN